MSESITVLLDRLGGGDAAAMEPLIALVYPELKKMASSYLRGERPGHTLQPTELVHEAYLRLVQTDQVRFPSRSHFYAAASTIMRRILVDYARRSGAAKRSVPGAQVPITIGESILKDASGPQGATLVCAIDDALQGLAKTEPLKARLIEMRFFGGLTAEESAEALAMTVHAVRGQLRVGQAMLQRELQRSNEG